MIKAIEYISDPARVERFLSAFANHQRHPNPCSTYIGTHGPSTLYLQDGKVYQVWGNTIIIVYDSVEFQVAVTRGDFAGFSSTRSSMHASWGS